MSKAEKEDLADYVRRVRTKVRKMSLQAVVDEAHRKGHRISRGYISQIENRYIVSVTSKKLQALAAGLSVDEDEMFAVARGHSLDRNGFEESEFYLVWDDVRQLGPQQQRDFKIAWDMAKEALRRIKEGSV